MNKSIAHLISKPRILYCLAVVVFVASATAQQTDSKWTFVENSTGIAEVSSTSTLVTPLDAGSAILKIIRRPSGSPTVIVYLIIESPKRLPTFHFEKYDGPIEKTAREFMKFEIISSGNVPRSRVRVMPNGYYAVTPPDSFIFDTIDGEVISFLSKVEDGQKISIVVNGYPDSIKVVFDSAGLKQALQKLGIKTVPLKK